MIVEYDEKKNQRNLKKYHISIPELVTIFDNSFTIPKMDIPDKVHIKWECRYWAYGWTSTGWYVWIWYTYRKGKVRIIGGKKLK